VSTEHVPFAQQHLEAKTAKAISERLAKAEGVKRKETAEEARKRVLAGVDISRWSSVTRRDGAVRAAVQAAHAARDAAAATPPEKPRTRYAFIPHAGQVVEVRLKRWRRTAFGKIVDWGAGGATVATRDGEIRATWNDMRPVPERELERMALLHDEDIEEQGVRLSKFAFDDLRPNMLIQVGPNDWTHARGRVVYTAPQESAHQFLVIRTADGRYIAALPSEIQILPREDGTLPE